MSYPTYDILVKDCAHGSGDDAWHGDYQAFCNKCGFCGRCQGTGFSVMSGYPCRSCDLTGNESRDYLQTRTEGTSLTALLGVADSGAIKLLRDQQRWKIAQAKAAQQINTKP